MPSSYQEYRYILGTEGNNPLICIGINPSTAEPGNLDNTLKSVERLALFNGFDSFIMFNIYAQRATCPKDVEREFNEELHASNMDAFDWVLSRVKEPAIWAAWGTIIESRPYFMRCLNDMAQIGEAHSARWYSAGKMSLKGHPHHPLYLRKDTPLVPFALRAYLRSVQTRDI